MSNPDTNTEADVGMFDFDRIMKLMEMVKAMNTGNRQAEPGPVAGETLDKLNAGDLDARLNSADLLTMKSFLPYLATEQRRQLAIVVKLMEIQRLIEFCKEIKEKAGKTGQDDQIWTVALLDYAKKNLEPAGQTRIELLIEFIKISDIIRRLKEMELNERR